MERNLGDVEEELGLTLARMAGALEFVSSMIS